MKWKYLIQIYAKCNQILKLNITLVYIFVYEHDINTTTKITQLYIITFMINNIFRETLKINLHYFTNEIVVQ